MKNKKIVILGGGTGLSILLRGIKYIKDIDISAIVSVADDGKSTGVLRKHFAVPAVGDLRRVISSLSRDRAKLDEILEYRFKDTKTDLDGHTIGNLIIISQIMNSKSFSRGIANTCEMLNVHGKIIPVSNDMLSINAEFTDGTIAHGESTIHTYENKKIERIFYDVKNPEASSIAIQAIEEADIIIIGIGSLYSSIMPNLIFTNMKKALKNTKARIFYFANIFTEPGETDDMTIYDHIKAIEEHTFKNIIDEVVVNNSKIPEYLIEKYNAEKQFRCKNDLDNKKIKTRYFELLDHQNKDVVRHDEKLIEEAVKTILNDIRT